MRIICYLAFIYLTPVNVHLFITGILRFVPFILLLKEYSQ